MVITILSVEGERVRLGFEADSTMPIHHREVRVCRAGCCFMTCSATCQ
jgi:sRNA-binding carbon storage regulator CsrA